MKIANPSAWKVYLHDDVIKETSVGKWDWLAWVIKDGLGDTEPTIWGDTFLDVQDQAITSSIQSKADEANMEYHPFMLIGYQEKPEEDDGYTEMPRPVAVVWRGNMLPVPGASYDIDTHQQLNSWRNSLTAIAEGPAAARAFATHLGWTYDQNQSIDSNERSAMQFIAHLALKEAPV